MTFLDVEKAIVRGLRDRVLSTADTIDIEAIRTIVARRQDGHWARVPLSRSNRTVPNDRPGDVPRWSNSLDVDGIRRAEDAISQTTHNRLFHIKEGHDVEELLDL